MQERHEDPVAGGDQAAACEAATREKSVMAYDNHCLRRALDPAYDADMRARRLSPEALEHARVLGDELRASTQRIFGEIDNAKTHDDFRRIGAMFKINPMEARRLILDDRRSPPDRSM